jgi:hypothetical protein
LCNNPAVKGTQYVNYRCTKDIPVFLFIKSPSLYNNIFSSDIPGGDGFVHAKITEEAGTFTVGFEDINGPGADLDYNDAILSVACTPDPTSSPEFPTLALSAGIIIGMVGVVLFVRKTKE